METSTKLLRYIMHSLVLLGYGFVGKAVHDVLKDHHNIIIVDPQYSNDTVEDQVGKDGYIVCLPTPQGQYGCLLYTSDAADE